MVRVVSELCSWGCCAALFTSQFVLRVARAGDVGENVCERVLSSSKAAETLSACIISGPTANLCVCRTSHQAG